ncbi:SDR family oxidoreductase [Streptomyces sp. NP160]|uniref:SDR family oxidoreductase n=1 Tax=Streptomyces sp. NP160 TaxID=2586637 RepID=UPI00111A132B|nr:SDR family oxidoreductase [Streptomyces sp. NP160]TNM68557.1 SDR family oxidoreductase [Streptomyces sp. NP160]
MSRVAVAGGTGAVGRLVVGRLRAAGHEPVVLSRSAGVDVLRGPRSALVAALIGCDAVVDVLGPTGPAAQTAAGSRAFFRTTTAALLRAGHEAGVAHHVALSVVGAARVDAGYYAGKALQERQLTVRREGGWTLLRTTQFHEFAPGLAALGALGGRGRDPRVVVVPSFVSQPVAAAEVADELVALAAGEPRGAVRDLAGPRVEVMADLVRRWLRARGRDARVVQVPLPGRFGAGLRHGLALPGPWARLGRQPFDDWLAAQP